LLLRGCWHQPEGPQALLVRCRELAMQVQVSRSGTVTGGHTACHLGDRTG
jgi:hypothetical protein